MREYEQGELLQTRSTIGLKKTDRPKENFSKSIEWTPKVNQLCTVSTQNDEMMDNTYA